MRLVTKINLALVGVVAISAVLNFAALNVAVMPSFSALEERAAEQNQGRVMEAIQLQKDQLANSAGDYAIWDDTFEFMHGRAPDYEEKNVTAESLKTLGVNYFSAIDSSGRIVLDQGFDHTGDEPRPIKLFRTALIPRGNALVTHHGEIKTQSSIMRTEAGLVIIGYSPILRSDRSGERIGTLVLGRLLDVDALKSATRVDFEVLDVAIKTPTPSKATLDKMDVLRDVDGNVIANVVSHTSRAITAVGERTILTTLALLLAAAAVLLVVLGVALRLIAVNRIEKLRSHIINVSSTGKLETMDEDGKNDELSETLHSFNVMAQQLGELRDKLRRQDYDHGAADQAAGLLHNVRNAISPVSALAWELARRDDGAWKQNLAKALEQLKDTDLRADRATKLYQFVAISTARLIDEESRRHDDLRSLGSMLSHIDDILRDQDKSSQAERINEVVDLNKTIRDAVLLVDRRTGITVDCHLPHELAAIGHPVPLSQVIANLVVNAAEAIGSLKTETGTIRVAYGHASASASKETIEILIQDDGVGIEKDHLLRIFENGYSTKPGGKRGLGLHWCANAVNAMGGRLVAESDGPGSGATFRLWLPSVQARKEAA